MIDCLGIHSLLGAVLHLATWRESISTRSRSNLIDVGGHGDHDGALEPTLTELRDGRLWMLPASSAGHVVGQALFSLLSTETTALG